MKKIVMSTLLSGVLTLGAGTAHAVTEIFLCAGPFNKTMDSDGAVIPMWGFAQMSTLGNLVTGCSTNPVNVVPISSPGPTLPNPDAGTGFIIHLFNDGLPESISIVIPGQNDTSSPMSQQTFIDGQGRTRVRAFTHEAAPGALASYGWNSLKPGTFIYKSGSHSALQVQMGLYGGLTQDSGILEAYTGHSYTSAVPLFYSEIDPVLHDTVAAGCYATFAPPPVNTINPIDPTCDGVAKPFWMTSTIGYSPRYFLLNGSDTPQSSATATGGPTLIRFFNAGYQNHVPVFQGLTMSMIAEDGSPYVGYSKQQYSVLLAAGQTADAIITPAVGSYSFYDRMLNLTNKTAGGAAILALSSPGPAGSLISTLEVTALVVDTDGDGIADAGDNCTLVPNPAQTNTNSDLYGNICDADLDNNGTVNNRDFSIFAAGYGTQAGDAAFNPDADLNSDGAVNNRDYSIFGALFSKAPGPAGVLP